MPPHEPEIWLMRHGQCADNEAGLMNGRRNSLLTAEGKKQALIKASELFGRGLTFDKIFCSPLARAADTAQMVSDLTKSNCEPSPLTTLTERCFGKWEGKPFAEMIDQVEHIKHGDYRFALDGPTIEQLRHLRGRADMALRQILMLSRSRERVLVVSHGYTLKAIEAAWYIENWKDVCKRGKFGNCEVRPLAPRARVIDIVPIIEITKPPSTRSS